MRFLLWLARPVAEFYNKRVIHPAEKHAYEWRKLAWNVIREHILQPEKEATK